jgi:hypothetical protein
VLEEEEEEEEEKQDRSVQKLEKCEDPNTSQANSKRCNVVEEVLCIYHECRFVNSSPRKE